LSQWPLNSNFYVAHPKAPVHASLDAPGGGVVV